MSEFDEDWTKNDVPEDPAEYTIGRVSAPADGQTVEQIEKENRFTTPEPGKHVMVIVGLHEAPKMSLKEAFVNGQLTSYESPDVTIKLSVVGNPNCRIMDRFTLPPTDEEGNRAYWHGVPVASAKVNGETVPSKMQAGIFGKRFQQLINRIGFTWGPGQAFPVEASRIGNWFNRPVLVTVAKGRGTYIPRSKPGEPPQPPVPRDSSVAWFGYDPAPAGGQTAPVDATKPTNGHTSNGTPALVGASVAEDAGLDAI